MVELTDDEKKALDLAQAVLKEAPDPVAVRHVAGTEQISDQRFLVILFRSQGFLFDRERGTTQVIALQIDKARADAQAALLESARAAAHRVGLTAVYFIGN